LNSAEPPFYYKLYYQDELDDTTQLQQGQLAGSFGWNEGLADPLQPNSELAHQENYSIIVVAKYLLVLNTNL